MQQIIVIEKLPIRCVNRTVFKILWKACWNNVEPLTSWISSFSFLTSAQLLVRYLQAKERRKEKLIPHKQERGLFHLLLKQRGTKENQKEKGNLPSALSSLLHSFHIHHLCPKVGFECACGIFHLSLKRLKWLHLDSVWLAFKLKCKSCFFVVFATCKMCCYRKILAAV